MSVTAPETTARLALINVIQTEFATEGFVVKGDHLHESLGMKGTVIGVSPNRSRPNNSRYIELETTILVQFYGKWDKNVNPEQSVDPTKIETYAERFRRALRTGDPNGNSVWFFNLSDVNYPADPTGNKTRFEATVVAVGSNPALIETVG